MTRSNVIGYCAQHVQVLAGRSQVQLAGQFDHALVAALLSDFRRGLPRPLGRGADDQIRDELVFAEHLAHARRVAFAAFVQRSVVVGQVLSCPARLGMSQEQ